MQPRTERTTPAAEATPVNRLRGDEAQLYLENHRGLQRAVSRAVNASPELIQDACQTAWTNLLRHQPDRGAVFAWLCVVAVHEAYRLTTIERRDARLEDLPTDQAWDTPIAGRPSLDDRLEAREALRALANLPAPQRRDLTLLVAGFRYREIAEITGRRTYTNVNKHLVKARRRMRLAITGVTGANSARRDSS
jgi:DNA-directed RNA polymerase specialized sigma24 family protein